MIQDRTLVIYHKDCFDGFGAAWICWKVLKGKVELFEASYGDNSPDVKDRDVLIVDFSYPRKTLLKMYGEAKSLRIFDHHKTAEEDLKGLDFCVFDMQRSGIGITWDVLTENACRPWLVNIIEDRDLWRFAYQSTKRAMAYIATIPFTVQDYDDLLNMGEDECFLAGESIIKYIDNYGKKASEHGVMTVIGKGPLAIEIPLINISYQNCSDHLSTLLDITGCKAAAYFFRRADKKWQFGLRSRGDFDVSEIARQYGGGGHKNAAGFEVEKLWF